MLAIIQQNRSVDVLHFETIEPVLLASERKKNIDKDQGKI